MRGAMQGLTRQIDELLQHLHAAVKPASASSRQTIQLTEAPSTTSQPRLQLEGHLFRPFALVDEVSAASPAFTAGIQVGPAVHDEIASRAGGHWC